MKVKFTEGPTALTVDEVGRVERGKTVEVSEELGKQLLEQGWSRVGAKKSPAKKKSSKKAAAPAKSAETTTPEPGPEKGDE